MTQVDQPLPAGTPAPDFTLKSTPDQTVSLHEFRGRPVILVFYPADWSPVCGDELALYQELVPQFENYGAQIMAISVDGPWSHMAFSDSRNITYPLLSDFEPKGKVSREYGAYDESTGESERALFLIDKDGVIFWSYQSPTGVNPGAAGLLKALDALQKKEQQS
jgi:peroxiredoxin (alkyl hydroperoxide reductase subunit C)